MDTPPQGWKAIERPAGLFRRYDFESYAQTRLYLELLAKESERVGRYPDLSFGPRHVNVTIAADGNITLNYTPLSRLEEYQYSGLTHLNEAAEEKGGENE